MAERVLMLIDGHSMVFRGFYALQETRPFTNAKGELTTGVYAFTSMLLKAIEDLKPQYAAAAFDMSRPTVRLNEFAQYKGTRTAAPPGMREQITWSRRVLEAMQIPMFERSFVPFLVMIDREGMIRFQHTGSEAAYFDTDPVKQTANIRAEAEKLLAERPAKPARRTAVKKTTK